MNNSFKYLFVFLITFALFGQDNAFQSKFTFKKAVEQYNNADYEETELILENMSSFERKYFREEIALLTMRVKYRLNEYRLSREIGKSLLTDNPNSEYKIDVLITFGDIFLAQGMNDAAFRSYINSYRVNTDKNYQNNIIKRILLTLQLGISPDIPNEYLSTEIDQNLVQILLLAKAHTEIEIGQIQKASNTLSEINIFNLNEINYDYYIKLTDKTQSQKSGKLIVGVVLPLTGKDAKIGAAFLEGLKQAGVNKVFNDMDLSLFIYDNAGDELKTLEAFKKLSNNPKIIAVIGPISTNNAIISASIAETSGIPLILPVVTENGLSSISENIFLMNSDLKTRGELAGQFIAESYEAGNIAVLAPADKFGKSIVDAFVNQLKIYNQSPQIIEWYSGIPMNLDRQFKSIRAKDWELLNEKDSIDFLNTVSDSIATLYGFDEGEMTADDSSQVILNSIDVIYMPIHSGDLEYIGAQFPAYNLDAAVVGNDNWADMEVLQKENVGPHFEGLVVLSNYNNCQIDSLNKSLNKKHAKYFYQAIDCYNLLAESIAQANKSNKSLTKILSNIDEFKGIFGTYNFIDSANNVNSNLNIVQFDGNKFDKYVAPNQSDQY